jgi:hypothetical protein
MATLDYTKRLTNLQNRKFDRELNESLISKSFSSKLLPDNVKYLVESMRPIDQKYNQKTIEAAGRVQKHLQDGYNLHFNRAFRTQGSVRTATNIKVHSDFDLLAIIDRYHYNAPDIPNESDYIASNPDEDILELRRQSTKILKSIYDEVDDKGEKCVSVFNKSLNRKVDIVFCFWYHSQQYIETNNEYYKGIYLYKFPTKTKELDFPFAHLSNINFKGDSTSDGSRRGIRLLKTLRADSEIELKILKSFHLTTIVHAIRDAHLQYSAGNELSIAKAISDEMNRIINEPQYRKDIKSPNGTETPLKNDDIVPEIKKLKEDLDTLIEDSSKEILKSPVIKNAILTY